jgi:hypothetical protein
LKAEELNRRQNREVHGMRTSPEYKEWKLMKKRCYDPKYRGFPKYGGVGITVSDEWRRSFANFYRDLGSRPSSLHTVARIDDSRQFSADNCRWLKTRCRSPVGDNKYKGQFRVLEPDG